MCAGERILINAHGRESAKAKMQAHHAYRYTGECAYNDSQAATQKGNTRILLARMPREGT